MRDFRNKGWVSGRCEMSIGVVAAKGVSFYAYLLCFGVNEFLICSSHSSDLCFNRHFSAIIISPPFSFLSLFSTLPPFFFSSPVTGGGGGARGPPLHPALAPGGVSDLVVVQSFPVYPQRRGRRRCPGRSTEGLPGNAGGLEKGRREELGSDFFYIKYEENVFEVRRVPFSSLPVSIHWITNKRSSPGICGGN